MLRLIGLAVSIGLADSLNPTTIAPALYLASGQRGRARRNVAEFTFGVFAVYLIGGAVIALGPGQLLLALIPKPGREARLILETVVGAALIAGSLVLWHHRDRVAERKLPQPKSEGRSSAILGATITAIELPTAFPYFAVIAAIVGSGIDPARQLLVLLLFNLCFIAPLLGILATLTFAGSHADRLLAIGRNFLQRNWPLILSGLMFLAGLFVVLLGVTGLASTGHTRFNRFMRHFRHLLHP
jgi:cytochrome c biogenesis protein CcdA